MISRRSFGALVASAVATAPITSRGQQPSSVPTPGRVFRIGLLLPERIKGRVLQGLHDAGYDIGRNLIIEHRPNDRPEMLARFAADLVPSTWM